MGTNFGCGLCDLTFKSKSGYDHHLNSIYHSAKVKGINIQPPNTNKKRIIKAAR